MPADTFSSTLGVLLMGTGNDNNSWGNNANSSVFQIFEDSIANALTSNVTGGTLDLSGTPPPTGPSQVRFAALIFTGTLTSGQIIKVPNLPKWWMVKNATSGAFTLTIQTPTVTLAAVIPQNSGWQQLYCDGNQNITVAPFNWNQIQMPDGSAAAPAFSDINEPNSGWYRNGAGDWRLSILGTDILQVTGTNVNLLNNAGSNVLPSGTELAFAGPNLPLGFLYETGQTLLRASFPTLLNALRLSFTCTFANGSPTLSAVGTDLRNLGLEGGTLECSTSGITNLTISSITSNTITMSGNATANSGGTVTVLAYPWGNGNGTTTFVIPDRRGKVIAGRDNMGVAGAAAAGRLTTAGSGVNGSQLNGTGGSQNQSILQANLPVVNFTVSATALTAGVGTSGSVSIGAGQGSHGHSLAGNVSPLIANGTVGATGGIVNTGSPSPVSVIANTLPGMSGTFSGSVSGNAGITGVAISGGSGTVLVTTQPTGVSNMIIKT